MTYTLALIIALASGQQLAIEDKWNPTGYATRAECEARRKSMELHARSLLRPGPVVVLVSKCERVGEVV
jgi:hypothetical protein